MSEGKNKVDKTVYLHEDGVVKLTTYTAKWCGPCNRIKLSFPELLKNYTLVSTEEMDKELYKKTVNDVIPFFVKSVQTSDTEQFRTFLGSTYCSDQENESSTDYDDDDDEEEDY
jgi:thiol-disulfide isomerase/thioredoxin